MTSSPDPFILHFEVTDQCNQTCPMCGTRFHALDRTRPALDRETVQSRVLAPARAAGFKVLVISGGEPTLAPHLPDTLQDALNLGYDHIFMATNLLQVSPQLLDTLLGLLNGRQHALQVSLDSSHPDEMNVLRGKKVFDQVVANCRRLLDRRRALASQVLLTAQLVLQAQNASSALDTVDWILNDLGFDRVMIQLRHDYTLPVTPENFRKQTPPAYAREAQAALWEAAERLFALGAADPRVCPEKGSLEDWKRFLTEPQKIQKPCRSCEALYVDAYGRVRGCVSGEVLGNLLKTDPQELLRSPAYRRFREFSQTCRLCTHSCS